MAAWVIDTNVLLVADGQHDGISDACRDTCIERLRDWPAEHLVVLDDRCEMLNEYLHKLDLARGKSVASLFLKDVLRNPARRLPVTLIDHPVTVQTPTPNCASQNDESVCYGRRQPETGGGSERLHHPVRGYLGFPDDADLERFDPPDRKFVAAAAASPEAAPILQAADCKWLAWLPALQRHGIAVVLLCPDDLARFAANKGLSAP